MQFATGGAPGDRVGSTIFTQSVPANTVEGDYGPFHIAGNQLANDPAAVTHIVAASSDTGHGSVPDVRITYGANANAAAVSAGMLDAVTDSLRAAGQDNSKINSTARRSPRSTSEPPRSTQPTGRCSYRRRPRASTS